MFPFCTNLPRGSVSTFLLGGSLPLVGCVLPRSTSATCKPSRKYAFHGLHVRREQKRDSQVASTDVVISRALIPAVKQITGRKFDGFPSIASHQNRSVRVLYISMGSDDEFPGGSSTGMFLSSASFSWPRTLVLHSSKTF